MKYIKCNILNPVAPHKTELLKNVVMTIDNDIISNICSFKEFDSANKIVIDKSDKIILPGLIDTHVHLSQWRIRGSYKSDLLEWLATYTFPEEERFFNLEYARTVTKEFFLNLIAGGTTTAAIYVTVSQEATNIAFEQANKLNYRAMIGKVCMDRNSPPALLEKTDTAFQQSVELCQQWDNVDNLNYVFSPRFAPVCSTALMNKIGNYAQVNNKYIQTHLSENKNEVALVKELFPQADSYTDVYRQCQILGARTIMGHAIHLTDNEINMLKETDTKLAHCPDSNFFLKSGRFLYKELVDKGLVVGLGSDVAGGTCLDMFYHMKMANYTQTDGSVGVQEAFYLATLGGAHVLSKAHEIGSITAGKKADFLVVNLDNKDGVEEILSELIFVRGKEAIEEVYCGGKKLK